MRRLAPLGMSNPELSSGACCLSKHSSRSTTQTIHHSNLSTLKSSDDDCTDEDGLLNDNIRGANMDKRVVKGENAKLLEIIRLRKLE